MRIGIYTPYLDTLAGGEKYMLTIASCLAQEHDVSLFWSKTAEEEIKKTVKAKFNLDLSRVSFIENIFTSKTSFLSRLSKTKEFDSILVLSDGSIPVVSSKLLLHFQTPMPWIHPSLKTNLKLLRVSRIICNSYFTKKYIDQEFGVESSVIYPPVVIDKKNEKKENSILHVGRFGIQNEGSSAKKQEFMAETFKKMVDAGLSGWKLIFVISYKDDVKNLVNDFKNDIQNYPIELIENPSNELLWQMYTKAKIYWHASGFGEDLERNPGRAEHFGISTVEAMGAGAVPVVINAGGQTEIVDDGENGFLWNTQEELMEKTRRIIMDTALMQKVSHEAEKRAKDFSKDHFCAQWMKEIL